ncbi:MAG: SRPBCC family protein [Actinomycetota bacterium]|nr:SRPBCC family protein [Actinomycetota bacterium]
MSESVKDSIDVKASAEDVFAVATDFEAYPEWNANIKKVEIRERDGDGRGTKVWYEVDAKVKTVAYTLTYEYSDAPRSFSWDLLDGDVKELTGSYTFDEFDDVTEVVYETAVDPGFPIPKLLKRQAQRAIVRGALEDLKKRVESR